MNYFLDCGTHFGQGITQISSIYNMDSFWKIYTFEANPTTFKIFNENQYNEIKLRYPLLESMWCAISNKTGEMQMNIEIPPNEGETGQGSSIINKTLWNPQNGTLTFADSTVTVPTINFSEWILNNIHKNPGDTVIVKLDIEGSEYSVLEQMLEDGSINLIDELLVEFHHHFFTNID